MPIFRIVCALCLLFAVAPDKTTEVLQGLLGWSQSVQSSLPANLPEQFTANLPLNADQALVACRINPEICLHAPRSAAKAR